MHRRCARVSCRISRASRALDLTRRWFSRSTLHRDEDSRPIAGLRNIATSTPRDPVQRSLRVLSRTLGSEILHNFESSRRAIYTFEITSAAAVSCETIQDVYLRNARTRVVFFTSITGKPNVYVSGKRPNEHSATIIITHDKAKRYQTSSGPLMIRRYRCCVTRQWISVVRFLSIRGANLPSVSRSRTNIEIPSYFYRSHTPHRSVYDTAEEQVANDQSLSESSREILACACRLRFHRVESANVTGLVQRARKEEKEEAAQG